MRLLVDEHGMPWELAWTTTTSIFNYTNHTLLPEALETWPVALLENLLPRHMQIIYLINALHLDAQRNAGHDDDAFLSSISMIEENHSRRVRMGHLAFLGSRRVNGVSALHTDLMRQTVFRDLNAIYPDRIVNKTNGISFRRWLYQANPGLTKLIVEAIGPEVEDDPTRLEALAALADDASFRERFAAVRRANKVALARVVAERLGFGLDPDALFDVHIKRIHEYKRQLLNILETIALYNAMRAQPTRAWVPRVKIFAGKAAAGLSAGEAHHQARLRRRARRQPRSRRARPAQGGFRAELQREPRRSDHPGGRSVRADLDGRHGSFRHRQHEARAQRRAHDRHARRREHRDTRARRRREHVHLRPPRRRGRRAAPRRASTRRRRSRAPPALAEVLNAIDAGMFSPDDKGRYRGLVDALRHHDYFMVTADFEAYRTAQRAVERALAGQERVVAHRRAQYGADELVLRRSRDPGLRPGNLARGTGPGMTPRAPGGP